MRATVGLRGRGEARGRGWGSLTVLTNIPTRPATQPTGPLAVANVGQAELPAGHERCRAEPWPLTYICGMAQIVAATNIQPVIFTKYM